VHTIHATLTQLQPLVRALRQEVTDPEGDLNAAVASGRALFDVLFPAKVRKTLQEAKRLLISPDGPLWDVPFAALISNRQIPPRYLGVEKAITYTPSLSL